jgi:hypothetical protein
MRTTRTLAAVLLFLLPVACGDDDDGGTTAGTPSGADGAPGGGEGGLFIELAFVGGFVAPDFTFRNLPNLVVYDDGTVVAPGAVAAVYPGPAFMPAFTGHVDDAVLDELVAAASDAGMVGSTPDVGQIGDLPIADAASTRVTVVVDGDERVVEAYALAEAGGTDFGQTGLDERQVAARAALSRFVATVTDAVTPAADEPLTPERYRVLAGPAVDPAGFDDPAVQPTIADWPAEVPVPPEGECTAITGDAVAPFAAALEQANELTQWRAGDRTFSLAVRVVLPHEEDCPPVGG